MLHYNVRSYPFCNSLLGNIFTRTHAIANTLFVVVVGMTNFYFYYNYCYGRLRRWVMDQSCMHHWFDEISHWTIFCIQFSFLFLFSSLLLSMLLCQKDFIDVLLAVKLCFQPGYWLFDINNGIQVESKNRYYEFWIRLCQIGSFGT